MTNLTRSVYSQIHLVNIGIKYISWWEYSFNQEYFIEFYKVKYFFKYFLLLAVLKRNLLDPNFIKFVGLLELTLRPASLLWRFMRLRMSPFLRTILRSGASKNLRENLRPYFRLSLKRIVQLENVSNMKMVAKFRRKDKLILNKTLFNTEFTKPLHQLNPSPIGRGGEEGDIHFFLLIDFGLMHIILKKSAF